jgi:hypothetical protein
MGDTETNQEDLDNPSLFLASTPNDLTGNVCIGRSMEGPSS